MEAMKLGLRLEPAASIYHYKNFEAYHMLDLLAEKKDIADFCCPLVMNLIEYDKNNQDIYAETLFVYLKCGKNSKKSASTLNIHHNTMGYRLRKIEEITNIDWDDGELLAHILCSFLILKLSKKIAF